MDLQPYKCFSGTNLKYSFFNNFPIIEAIRGWNEFWSLVLQKKPEVLRNPGKRVAENQWLEDAFIYFVLN